MTKFNIASDNDLAATQKQAIKSTQAALTIFSPMLLCLCPAGDHIEHDRLCESAYDRSRPAVLLQPS